MATFIDGDNSTFDMLVYGNRSFGSDQFIQNQRDILSTFTSPNVAGFFQRAFELEHAMVENRAYQMASASMRKIASVFQDDAIRCLTDLGEFQHAPASMRRFIMANPVVRNMWKEQRCDGYNDFSEYNQELDDEDNLDYCQVMDGVPVVTTDKKTGEIGRAHV